MPIGSVAEQRRACAVVRPVAASASLRSVLARPAAGRVLGAFPSALYVDVGDDVVAVVTRDGLRLPNALVLPVPADAAPFAGHRPGSAAEVRDGGLQVGDVHYRPARWWAPRALRCSDGHVVQAPVVRALARRLAAAAPDHDADVEDALTTAGERLRAGLLRGDDTTTSAAAAALLGLGPGLTPSGDDLLAGVLVTCAQLGAQSAVARTAAQLGPVVAGAARSRTTALSAALLQRAATGEAAEPVLAVVEALTGRRPLEPALTGLLAVGHTSGHDTARGVTLAAEALLADGPVGSPGGRPRPPAMVRSGG